MDAQLELESTREGAKAVATRGEVAMGAEMRTKLAYLGGSAFPL